LGDLLVIDTETAGRSIVRGRLADAGHNVLVAEESSLGIEAALGHDLDCVLVAAQLEDGTTGVDVCRDLCVHRELEDTPLIVYSLLAEDDALLPRALDAGAHAAIHPDEAPLLERIVAASIACHQRVAGLRDRLDVLRQEQRRLSDLLGSGAVEAAAGDPDSGALHPEVLLVVDRGGVVRLCDRDSWTLLGRNCVGMSLRQLAPSSGLDRFVREARTTAQHGFRFDLSGQDGVPGRPLVASVHPLGVALRLLFLNDCARCRALGDDRQGVLGAGQAASLLDAAAQTYGLDRVPGDGPTARHLRHSVAARASDREPLLLVGEPGSGRGFIARVLHYLSPEPGAFLRVRCSCFFPESLERELFGSPARHGDDVGSPGALLLAGRGTVLLEDVEALPPRLQGRLLEVLRKRSVRPSGSWEHEACEARIVASTSHDLLSIAERGAVLPDLAELLGAWRLDVPPLRSREAEVTGILQDALGRAGAVEPDEEVLALLRQHCWLRNLEELDQVAEDAARSAAGAPLRAEHLPRALDELDAEYADGHLGQGYPSGLGPSEGVPPSPWAIGQDDPISFEFYEKQAIVRALHACRGDRLEAARLLRVGKSTLYRKIRSFGLQ